MTDDTSRTVSYRVDGMTCQGCARSVTNAITRLAPAAKVAVDLEAHTVAVTGSVTAAQVEDAVDGAGFTFGGPV